MRDSQVIAAMAEASLRCGAVGVRLESPEHIGAVRRRCPDALIIDCGNALFPTAPSTSHRDGEVQGWSAGADVIALDATQRRRPDGQRLEELIQRCRSELRAPLMADVDSVSNGLNAAELGCDWVGTTLYGYTEDTAGQSPPGRHCCLSFGRS